MSLSLLFKDWVPDEGLVSVIITIGYFMGLLIVPMTVLSYIAVASIKKEKLKTFVPVWLVIANIIFLFVLLFYIFYLNDPYYNQA